MSNTEKIEFTKEDKEFFAATRTAQPAVDELFKDVRSLMDRFANSQITYLQVGSKEWGELEEGVIPNVPPLMVKRKKARPATTQNAKRRAITKYKE